jgi:DNA-binding LytR/AlgR family response regulator
MLLKALRCEVVATCCDINEALQKYTDAKPDLAIINIGLLGGNDGLQLSQKISERATIPIIFVTSEANKDYVNDPTDTLPHLLLTEPVQKGELEKAIQQSIRNTKHNHPTELPLGNSIDSSESTIANDSIFVRVGNKIEKVTLKDILWVELAEEKYCNIMLESHKLHIRKSLNNLLDKLSADIFIRVHRQYIVNIDKIDYIDSHEQAIIIKGHAISIGPHFMEAFIKRLNLI